MLVSTGALPTLATSQTAPTALASITFDEVEYWHKDHLGSLASTTDNAGNVTARYEYDPFGKRRTAGGQYDANGNVVIDWSDAVNHGDQRGFTGHEQLDDVGMIHMNGRTYDPYLGRFMQPDPMIQAPGNLQSYNRYSYCMNSPMICTDPSLNVS
jgi:RHS repeat-associated protein